MRDVVGAIEVDAVPAALSYSANMRFREKRVAYVGKRRLTMMPAGQGLEGKSLVSG